MKARRGRVLVPSLFAGLLLALCVPPFGFWPLAFLGAALLYWRLAGLGLRARVLAGWTAGLGCFVPGLWWAAAFNWYGAVVLILLEALFMAVAAALVPPRRLRVPAFAAAFTLLEALRMSWPFGGLPLGGVALGQAGGPLLGAARLGGPFLLEALVWLGGAGLGAAAMVTISRWLAPRGRGGKRPTMQRGVDGGIELEGGNGRTAGAIAALVLTISLPLAGALAPSGGVPTTHLAVALVQGGGRRGTSALEVPPAHVLAAQVDASRRLERQRHPPALVVWPEDVIAVGPRLAGTAQAASMARFARTLGATVVAGVTEDVSSTAFRNEAVVWAPTGRIVGVYEKVHRVPFGEYVPDRAFFAHFADLSAVPLDAIPGHGSGELATPAGRIGVMLSYEVFFATRGRSAVRAGARLLVVPTNTTSYATSQVPTMEVAADRIQAVAEGRTLLQAAPTGYSTVVTAAGAVLQRSVLGRREVLQATVGLRDGRTVYEELGDFPVLGLAGIVYGAVVTLIALGAARGHSATGARRTRPPGQPPAQ